MINVHAIARLRHMELVAGTVAVAARAAFNAFEQAAKAAEIRESDDAQFALWRGSQAAEDYEAFAALSREWHRLFLAAQAADDNHATAKHRLEAERRGMTLEALYAETMAALRAA